MGFIKSFVISIQSSKGFIVLILTCKRFPDGTSVRTNPILSLCDKEPPAELFAISIAEINSLTDVGMYAGVLPHAILKCWSLY